VLKFRCQYLKHLQVMAGFEALGGDYGAALYFVQRVFQFVQAIGRIKAHHNRPDAGSGVLCQYPLSTVWPPDADAISGFYAQRKQASGQPVNLQFKLTVGPANALVAHHQCLVVRVTLANFVQVIADRLVDDRFVGSSAEITLRQ